MRQVKRSALMPYSCEQMFEVVNDVLAYPAFLPWCSSAKILSQDDELMVANLELAQSGLRHSFTTRNRLNFPASIEMELVEGPFSKLSGSWRFARAGDDGTRVTMNLSFDFNSRLFNMTLARVFSIAADKMVDAFCERADVLYG